MRLLLLGASGTIGAAISQALSSRCDIVTAGREDADVEVDLGQPESIAQMYRSVSAVDAVACAAGYTASAPLTELTAPDVAASCSSKLAGQVNLVLQGLDHINDSGSFTLITGQINRDPVPGGSLAAMANAGIEGFVQSAADELPRGIRINAVSPQVIAEVADRYGDMFVGREPVPAARVGMAYERSVFGHQTGQVYSVV